MDDDLDNDETWKSTKDDEKLLEEDQDEDEFEPYKCTKCDFNTMTEIILTIHMAVHNKSRPILDEVMQFIGKKTDKTIIINI